MSFAVRRSGSELRCRFLAGCDGDHSTVRRLAGVDFVGGEHHEEVILADVELDGPLEGGSVHVAVGGSGLVILFPLGEGASWRLLATRPAGTPSSVTAGGPTPRQEDEAVPTVDLSALLQRYRLGAKVTTSRWSAVIPLQHRVAASFRQGPVFFAGDAAHVHSPAAAQGMNTGLLDAVNLGWRLAFSSTSGSADALLSSYGDERRPVARRVVALTRLVFFVEASASPLAQLFRGVIAPLAAPAVPRLAEQRWLMAAVYGVLSRRWASYRNSQLSVDDCPKLGGPRPGDLLPDDDGIADEGVDRHLLTARPGVHLLLDRDATEPAFDTLGPWVTVHRHPTATSGTEPVSWTSRDSRHGCTWSAQSRPPPAAQTGAVGTEGRARHLDRMDQPVAVSSACPWISDRRG